MLTFNRSLARQVRSILRRTFNLPPRNYARTAVQLIGTATGLTIRYCTDVAAVQIHHATPQSAESLIVPFKLFDDCEGKRNDPVTIERDKDSQISAQWLDGRVPQLLRYDALEMTAEFPQFPSQFVETSPDLLVALQQASGIADDCTSRYALSHIRLRGQDGSIAATDGRHLLLRSGFQFGFDSDALIPRTSVFGCPEMPHGQPVALGIQDGWLAMRTGPVTLSWKLDPELRFPRVDEYIRSADSDLTTLEIDEQDARFLRESLRSLPHDVESIPELTVDLNGSVAMRIKPRSRPKPIEFVLNRSQWHGAEVRFMTDARYLDKALELGFRRFRLVDRKASVVCRDRLRYYVWMTLDPSGVITASADMDRIDSVFNPDPVRTSYMARRAPGSSESPMIP